MRKYRFAFLVSHPIQYMSPLFKEIAGHPQVDLTVLYCSDESIKEMKDVEFGRAIKWDIPLLEGYSYKFLKNYSPLPSIFKVPAGLVNIGIIGEIWRNRYDAIGVHGWHYITHWLLFITAILRGTPFFIRSDAPLNQELLKSKFKILIKKLVLGTLFKHVTGFFTIGSENREFYKFYGVDEARIYSVPYAVENDRFIDSYNKLLNNKEKIKKEIGISSDKIIILFSGKLIDKKRPKDLLMAYERINFKDKALIYVGDGKLREELENYTKERDVKNVFFLGFKNQTELPGYYAVSDIFVLPSTIGETWGLAVNEAMCFCLPIIVSDLVGCAKDLVRDGENGFIFKMGNIEELAGCLEKLIRDGDLRKRMGNRSFEIIKDWNYTNDVNGIIEALEKRISK